VSFRSWTHYLRVQYTDCRVSKLLFCVRVTERSDKHLNIFSAVRPRHQTWILRTQPAAMLELLVLLPSMSSQSAKSNSNHGKPLGWKRSMPVTVSESRTDAATPSRQDTQGSAAVSAAARSLSSSAPSKSAPPASRSDHKASSVVGSDATRHTVVTAGTKPVQSELVASRVSAPRVISAPVLPAYSRPSSLNRGGSF